MSSPYDYNDEIASQFFELLGRIIIAWARVERAVDLLLVKRRVFRKGGKSAILNWSEKYKALKLELPKLYSIKSAQQRALFLLEEINKFAPFRHIFVHGYYQGIINEVPPLVQMEKSQYHADFTKKNDIKIPIGELSDILKKLQSLDQELGLFVVVELMDQNKQIEKHHPTKYRPIS